MLEHDDLRRARDIEHYRLARQLGRTIVTLDRDYIDDRNFPPAEGAGVIVFWAPDEPRLRRLLSEGGSHAVSRRTARPRSRSKDASCTGNWTSEDDALTGS